MKDERVFTEAEEDKMLEDMLFEECILEDLYSLPEDVRKEYLASEEASLLEAKRLINGKTRIRMSKMDDLKRRIALGAMAMAKIKRDPLYTKFALYKSKSKICKRQMIKKYSQRVVKAAKMSQKNYLKKAPTLANLKNKVFK